MNSSLAVCFTLSLTETIYNHRYPHFWSSRSTIVHLFEWKWIDIAEECENFLQHKGYAGVQISPPSENLICNQRPWWERYQPVSYKISSRSGDESDFENMTRRCNAVGIRSRIYADVVINHMTGRSGAGISSGQAYYHNKSYPSVPYDESDFHPICTIYNYQDAENVRNCQLKGLLDLDQSKNKVREKIIEYLNRLIRLGVAGFRVDAAKHMWPEDLEYIYSKLDDLNTKFGFDIGSRPFIYQEVIDYGGEAISKHEYSSLGAVVEFKASYELNKLFRGGEKLAKLVDWGASWKLVDSKNALVFIDNHDTQRDNNRITLTYKQAKRYKMAIAFMLAYPYGTPRIISSYHFETRNQGPPTERNGNLKSPINSDGACKKEYVCEHRWRQIYNMVEFKNVVSGTGVTTWWSNNDQQIAFCRGDRGFIIFTNGGDVYGTFQTCLSSGVYCDVVSGELRDGRCTGKSVSVSEGGLALIKLRSGDEDGVLAIHVKAKILLSSVQVFY